MKNEPHVHVEMIVAKAKNMSLVKLIRVNPGCKWQRTISNTYFDEQFEYFLCHEKHLKSCLHWLNNDRSGVDFTHNDIKEGCDIKFVFRDPGWDITIKPKTITINGIEVPEPCREPLEMGQTYYTPALVRGAALYRWSDCEVDKTLLGMGLIHLPKEAAELHTTAILNWSKS